MKGCWMLRDSFVGRLMGLGIHKYDPGIPKTQWPQYGPQLLALISRTPTKRTPNLQIIETAI